MSPQSALLHPFWSIAEGENDLIVIAEYGNYVGHRTPHRRVLISNDVGRKEWSVKDFQGRYMHVHCYQINPYLPNVHLLGLGDFLEKDDPTPAGPYGVGFFVSTDNGLTFGKELLRTLSDYPYNAPVMATFLPDGRAFICNDSSGPHADWWLTKSTDSSKIERAISLVSQVYPKFSRYPGGGEPVTPWSAMAVAGTSEVYCCASSDNVLGTNAPMPLFRYDADRDVVTLIALSENFGLPFSTLSGSHGNLIPQNSRYIFCNGYGGMRIPRPTETR